MHQLYCQLKLNSSRVNIRKCKTTYRRLVGSTKPSLVQFQHSSEMTFLHLNIYAWVPSTTPLYPWFSFNIKYDDLSALKHLCMVPLHYTTMSWVQFQHSSVMTFLHLNIYAWAPPTTPLYPWFSFNIKYDDLSALKHLCMVPLHYTTMYWLQFQHSSVMTLLHLNIYAWVPSTTPLYPWFSFNIQVWWPFYA